MGRRIVNCSHCYDGIESQQGPGNCRYCFAAEMGELAAEEDDGRATTVYTETEAPLGEGQGQAGGAEEGDGTAKGSRGGRYRNSRSDDC